MLTKTQFNRFIECSCQLWLIKQRPDLLPPLAPMVLKALDEGGVVDEYAKKLFPSGVEIKGVNKAGATATKKAIASGEKVLFQPTFIADGLSCRCDILVKNGDAWDIHEVKSTTEPDRSHVLDVTFQRVCLEKAGLKVGKTFVVHINNQYVRKGEIEPHKLFTTLDITKFVDETMVVARKEIARAIETLELTEHDAVEAIKSCEKPERCKFLPCYIGVVPHEDIYAMANDLPPNRLKAMLRKGLLKPEHVPPDVLESLGKITYPPASDKPVIQVKKEGLRKELKSLQFPLYFLDYETSFPTIPAFDGYRPNAQMVFQYSIHILREPGGELEHIERIVETYEDPSPQIAEWLAQDIGTFGTVIVWFMPFEGTRTAELARMVPKYAAQLSAVNERMYDLMSITKSGLYVDSRFEGSNSIKKVLPVMVPELSYKDLAIQQGVAASTSWDVLTNPKTPKKKREQLKKDMLAYCERDTIAMVEIYKKFLEAIR